MIARVSASEALLCAVPQPAGRRRRKVPFRGVNRMLTIPISRSAWGCLDVQLRGGVMALNRFGSTLADVEREHILETLARCDGNRTQTAKFLDISVRCLRMKLQHFGRTAPRVPSADLGLLKANVAFGHSSNLMISC
jgi:hypothetical protein